MYHGYATIAKGIKNTVRFSFVNGEQRATNINGKSFKFRLYDQVSNTQVLTKDLVVLDDTLTKNINTAQTALGNVLTLVNTGNVTVGLSVSGVGIQKNTTVIAVTSSTVTLSTSTTKIAPVGSTITFVTSTLRGIAELRLISDDTAEINTGRYTYAVLNVEDQNTLSPVYVDGAGTLTGNFEIVDTITPRYRPSDELTFLKVTGYYGAPDVWSTGPIAANRDGKGNNVIHTASFYYTAFTGTRHVYGTLSSSISGNNDGWVLVDTIELTDQTSVDYINLIGNFNYYKFEYLPDSGTIDKVVYRS